jgi:hypothetical protein
VRFTVVLLVVVGFFIVWLFNYPSVPSRWRYSFLLGRKQHAAWLALTRARLDCWSARGNARRRVAEAERLAAEKVRPLRLSVQELKAQRKALLQLGPGNEVCKHLWLGELQLYKHVLVFVKEQPPAQGEATSLPEVEHVLWLNDLEVTFERGHHHYFIRVQEPDGIRHTASYEHARYQELDVDRLNEAIRNQVVKDAKVRADRSRQAAEITAKIERVESERTGVEATGRSEIAAVKQKASTERARAEALLRDARDTWKSQGGGLRPLW